MKRRIDESLEWMEEVGEVYLLMAQIDKLIEDEVWKAGYNVQRLTALAKTGNSSSIYRSVKVNSRRTTSSKGSFSRLSLERKKFKWKWDITFYVDVKEHISADEEEEIIDKIKDRFAELGIPNVSLDIYIS